MDDAVARTRFQRMVAERDRLYGEVVRLTRLHRSDMCYIAELEAENNHLRGKEPTERERAILTEGRWT